MTVNELVNKLQTKWIRIYIEKDFYNRIEIFNATPEDLNSEVAEYRISPYIGDDFEEACLFCDMIIVIK